LAQVVRRYFAYHAVPTNARRLAAFRYYVAILWHRTLRQRSQKDWTSWERISRLVATYLPLKSLVDVVKRELEQADSHNGLIFVASSDTTTRPSHPRFGAGQ